MSREKQIEEMARLMCANYDGERGSCGDGTMCDHDCWAYREATHLHDLGYRKQSEGEWIFNRGRTHGEPAYYCSECSEGASEYGYDNFCPNCGAKMKGGAE